MIPRYLYLPTGLQLSVELIARSTAENLSIGVVLMFITIGLCIYVGARGVLVQRHMFSAALWSIPLTLLSFINGSLGFALAAPGYDPTVYLGFVVASTLFCFGGVVAGLAGGLAMRVVARTKSVPN